MKKILILIPRGGLCNRMRTITAASKLAQEQNKRMIVIWLINQELHSSFNNLFKPIPNKVYSFTPLSFYYRLIRRVIRYLKMPVIDDEIVREGFSSGYDWKHQVQDCSFVLNTCYNVNNYKDYSMFVIQNHIRNHIPSELDLNSMIGIHIRRTDNKKSIEFSPSELFINQITEEIKKNANAKFYLATDDKQEEMKLREKFGEQIFTYSKRSLDRNSCEGIEDALIDLYNLSQCKVIYASYWSSFSDLAADWRKIPRIVLVNKEIK